MRVISNGFMLSSTAQFHMCVPTYLCNMGTRYTTYYIVGTYLIFHWGWAFCNDVDKCIIQKLPRRPMSLHIHTFITSPWGEYAKKKLQWNFYGGGSYSWFEGHVEVFIQKFKFFEKVFGRTVGPKYFHELQSHLFGYK